MFFSLPNSGAALGARLAEGQLASLILRGHDDWRAHGVEACAAALAGLGPVNSAGMGSFEDAARRSEGGAPVHHAVQCASGRRSLIPVCLSGVVLLVTAWQYGVSPETQRRGESILLGGGRVGSSSDGRGSASSSSVGHYTWLDSFALGAGVQPRRPEGRVASRHRTQEGRLEQGQRPGGAAGEPRLESVAPHHSGSWKFWSDDATPSFIANVPALSDAAMRHQQQRQMPQQQQVYDTVHI